MNIVDLLIISMIAIAVISGMYRGFISSLLSTASFFVSWALSYMIYPSIANSLLGNSSVMTTLNYYTDAASKLGTGVARTDISLVSSDIIERAIDAISLPAPFDALLKQNIASGAFAGIDLSTVGDYVNQTIGTVVVDVLCFLIVFMACFVALNLIIRLINYVFRFPALKHLDALTGGVLGFARGYFFVYLLFTLVPILLTALPIQAISDYINASRLGAHFLESNFVTSIIKSAM